MARPAGPMSRMGARRQTNRVPATKSERRSERKGSRARSEDREIQDDGLTKRKPVEPDLTLTGGLRVGYVALVGRPNVGKSTILNQLLGQKIAATTHKPQTTRKNILGILHPKGAEILLLDTPGYHRAEGPLNRFMVRQAKVAIAHADVIGYVIEAREDGKITPGNEELIRELKRAEKPVILLINKIDTIRDKRALLLLVDRYRDALGGSLSGAAPISAIKRKGLGDAVREIAGVLPQGSPLFGEDEITDQSERTIVAEFVREKVVLETRNELPYTTAVTVDAFEDQRPRLVRITATIHVEKGTQKTIVIGHGGERLKAIGTRARKDIEHFLGAKVFLELNVRVTEGWTAKARSLEMLGYGAGSPHGGTV